MPRCRAVRVSKRFLGFTRLLLLEDGQARRRHLAILGAGAAAHPDCPQKFPADDNGYPAFHWHRAGKFHHHQPAPRHGIFQGLGRAFETDRGSGLFLSDHDAAKLGPVHALQIDRVTAIIHHTDHHVPVVLPCLSLGRRHQLFGAFQGQNRLGRKLCHRLSIV